MTTGSGPTHPDAEETRKRNSAERAERRAQVRHEWETRTPAERSFFLFREVVDELARKPGRFVVDETQRELITKRLLADFRRGALGDGRLLNDDPGKPFTPANMIEAEGIKLDTEVFRRGYVEDLMLDRAAVTRYFRAHGVEWPASWGIDPTAGAEGTSASTPAPDQAAGAPAATAQAQEPGSAHRAGDPKATRRKRSAPKRDLATKALKDLHGEPKSWPPPGGDILRQVNDRLKTEGYAPISMDTLQRAIGRNPDRK